jgi:hypothetical protein
VIGAPIPKVELTKPLVPVPTPPAATLARRILHDAGVHAQNIGSAFGPQNVGIGNVQVVACQHDVEIVLQGERNCIVDGQHDLAVVQQLINA